MHPNSFSLSEGQRKSWNETDWEELEKIWSRERNKSSEALPTLSPGAIKEFVENNGAMDGSDKSGNWLEEDLFLVSIKDKLNESIKIVPENGVDGTANRDEFDEKQSASIRKQLWMSRRRITI